MKIKLKRVDGGLKKLQKNLSEVDGEFSQIGYFEEQGQHESGYSLVDLMQLHEFGSEKIPARPVFTITSFQKAPNRVSIVKQSIRKWLKQSPSKDTSSDLLETIAEYYQKELRAVFGDTSKLKSNAPFTQAQKGSDSPLIDTGELKESLAYKTSKQRSLKT